MYGSGRTRATTLIGALLLVATTTPVAGAASVAGDGSLPEVLRSLPDVVTDPAATPAPVAEHHHETVADERVYKTYRGLSGVTPPADAPRTRAGRDQYSEPDLSDGIHTILVVPLARNVGEQSAPALVELDASIQEVATIWKLGSRATVKIRPRRLEWKRVAYQGCSVMSITAAADPVVKAAGINPNAYDSVVYYAPACGGGGQAYMPGARAAVYDASTRTMSHELGHNLGLDHAGTVTCPGTNDPTRCTNASFIDEYGDLWDVMGGGYSYPGGEAEGLFSGALLDELGWLTNTDRVTATYGTAILAPLGSATGKRVLRIPTSGGYLYVDYRPATGIDSWITDNHPLGGGVQVRFVSDTFPHPGQGLLATNQVEATTFGFGASHVFLRLGDRLQTGRAGITLTVTEMSPTSASVLVRPSIPARPRFVSAASTSATSITVRVGPSKTGPAPREYTIGRTGTAGTTTRSTSATFTGLRTCSKLSFVATGSNASGTSNPTTSPTYQVGRFTKPGGTAEYMWNGSAWVLRVRLNPSISDCHRITGYKVVGSSPWFGTFGSRTVGASVRTIDIPISIIYQPTDVTITTLTADGATIVGKITI